MEAFTDTLPMLCMGFKGEVTLVMLAKLLQQVSLLSLNKEPTLNNQPVIVSAVILRCVIKGTI